MLVLTTVRGHKAASEAPTSEDTELLRRIVTLLEEHPLTRDELQVETQSTSHQVDAVIAKLETAGEVDVSGSLVVRKQTRYHDDGTALSEEIEFADGHQDATVMPKAFAGVGSVPGQQIVQPLTLECGDGPGFDWQLGIHDADSWLRWYGSIDLTAGAYHVTATKPRCFG